MINIAAITPGKKTPSSRFRVRQYIPALNANDIAVREFPAPIYDDKVQGKLGKIKQRYILPISGTYEFIKLSSRIPQLISSYNYDITWLNRTFYNAIKLESLLKKPLVFDIDDAIWINNETHIQNIIQQSAKVICGNSYIAAYVNKFNKNHIVIPTGIDTEKYSKPSNKTNKFIIGWSGTRDNLKFLYKIEEFLNSFITKYSDVELRILCDSKPIFHKIKPEKVNWIQWNEAIEIKTLQSFNVGIMPLEDNEWAKGKCSFKMLQYMSCAIPVIASAVGMNIEVHSKGDIGFMVKSDSDWHDALETLYLDPNKCHRLGDNGRLVIEKNYSINSIVPELSKVFKAI